jgi:proteasome lid subunit RPN8/RPN11
MDINQIRKVFDLIKSRGEDLVGIYHSHPSAPPYPSSGDIANANYPDVNYMIVSFEKKQPEVRNFHIINKRVIPQSFHLL